MLFFLRWNVAQQQHWVDRVTAWLADRADFARLRFGGGASMRAAGVRSLGPSFLESQARVGGYGGGETMDVEGAQRLAATTSWVYSDVQLLAGRIASEAGRPVAAKYEGGKWVEMWDHAMTALLARPNGLMSGSFLLRYLAWGYFLGGNAYAFISTDRRGGGRPLELWPLVGSLVRPLPETLRESAFGGATIDYEYRAGGAPERLAGEHVVHFRTPNPWDYWQGLSPLTGALLAVQADSARAQWSRDFFGKDNAVPTAVIGLPQETSDPDFERVEAQIREEFGGRRRVAITRAGDFTVQTVQQTLVDMQMVESRSLSRQEIDRVYGIPDGLFSGAASGDSRLALESTLATNTVQPVLDYFAEEWTARLTPFYREAGLTMYARSVVPRDRALAVQEYAIFSLDRTVNENREELGLPRLELDGADVPVRLLDRGGDAGPGVGGLAGAAAPVAVMNDEAGKAAVAGHNAVYGEEIDAVGTEQAREGVRAELRRWRRVALREVRAGRKALERPFASDILPEGVSATVRAGLARAVDEEGVRAVFARWLATGKAADIDPLNEERSAAERALGSAWREVDRDGGEIERAAGMTRAEAATPDALFGPSWQGEYEQRLADGLLPVVEELATAAARAAAGGMGVSWELVNEAVLAWSEQYGYPLISGLAQTTQAQLQATISAWIASGEPLPELVSRLTPLFGSPVRAEMIAATEVTRLYQQANEAAWRQANAALGAGIVGGVWGTARDELVCPVCGPMQGATRSLESPGYLQPDTGVLILMPAHPRCRCWEKPLLAPPGSRLVGPGPRAGVG